jgi:hypothetical protein
MVDNGSSGNLAVTTPVGTSAAGFNLFPAKWIPYSTIQFIGSLVNTHAQLSWQTSNEKSIEKYIVEYSTDTLQFLAIDSL